jgi:hypothetical protein
VLTFFANSTYKDFTDQGRTAASMSGVLVNLLFLFKVHLKAVPQLQDRLVRLCNAAHYLSWMDLAGNEQL